MLALLGASNSGDLIEDAARSWRAKVGAEEGFRVQDAAGSKRKDGSKNGKNTTGCDWNEVSDGAGAVVGVECKSAGPVYDASQKRWYWTFQNIKAAEHKKRYFAILTPDGIAVFDASDLEVGTNGVKTDTCGGEITWNGPCGVTNAREALEHLLEKSDHLRIATLAYAAYAAILAVRTPAHYAFEGTPLAGISGSMRGLVGEAIVQNLATDLFGQPVTRPANTGLDLKGNERSASSATVDFLLGKDGLEIKTGTLCWDTSQRRWKVEFVGIKRIHHDRLVLVFHAPDGLHVIEHVGDFGWCETSGVVQVYAPAGTLKGKTVKPDSRYKKPASIAAHKKRSYELGDPAVATQNILKKFWLGGCPYITHIAF